MTAIAQRADILIVDDTPANLNVLTAILKQQGYRVRPAISGELALTAAQKVLPDVILLDIQMPGLNGYQVCRQLKADPRTAPVPVVFISALEDALDKVEAFQAGGVDYITKPFQIEEVLVRVENQLTLSRQRGQLAALDAHRARLAATLEAELQRPLDAILAEAEQLLADLPMPQAARLAAMRERLRVMQSVVAEVLHTWGNT